MSITYRSILCSVFSRILRVYYSGNFNNYVRRLFGLCSFSFLSCLYFVFALTMVVTGNVWEFRLDFIVVKGSLSLSYWYFLRSLQALSCDVDADFISVHQPNPFLYGITTGRSVQATFFDWSGDNVLYYSMCIITNEWTEPFQISTQGAWTEFNNFSCLFDDRWGRKSWYGTGGDRWLRS